MFWFPWFILAVMILLAVQAASSFYTIYKEGRFYKISSTKRAFFVVFDVIFIFLCFLGFAGGVPWGVFFLILGMFGILSILARIWYANRGITKVFVSVPEAILSLVVNTALLCVLALYLFLFF